MRVEADPEPFAAWSGYRFGLVEDPPVPGPADLPEVRTGEDGKAVLSLTLWKWPRAPTPSEHASTPPCWNGADAR